MAGKALKIINDEITAVSKKKITSKVEMRWTGSEQSNPDHQVTMEIGPLLANSLKVVKQAFDTYIVEEVTPINKDFLRVKERFEILDGSRNNAALGQRAVRFDNIRALQNITSQPAKSRKTINPSPTMEEFNALYDDLRVLYNALFEIGIQIRSHGTSK